MSAGVDGHVAGARPRATGRGFELSCGLAALALMATALIFAVPRIIEINGSAPPVVSSQRVHRFSAASAARPLSAGARTQIGSALGASLSAYPAERAGRGWRLAGDGLRAHVGLRDLTVGAVDGSLSLRLTGIGSGATLRSVGSVRSIEARGNRVTLVRARVREWYAAGPLGVEQGFTVPARPVGGPGRLTLALQAGGSLRAITSGGAITFLTRRDRIALRYGGLVALDAAGRPLASGITLRGSRIRLWVDTRHARYPVRIDPLLQIGSKLAPDTTTDGLFGSSVAVSSNGTVAVIGSPGDGGGAGGAWVFDNTGGVWTQVGPELVGDCASSCANQGTGETSGGAFGSSVAISGDGDTVAIGAPDDGAGGTDVSTGHGGVWVFVRSGNVFTQQAALVGDCTSSCEHEGTGEVGTGNLGASVALSASGDTLLAGAPGNGASTTTETPETGAAWVFTRSSGSWSQQAELTGSGELGKGGFGTSVAVASDGDSAVIGAPDDTSGDGAAWFYTRSAAGTWSAQGSALANPAPKTYATNFGASVALAGDSTALIGVPADSSGDGGAYAFTQSGGSWTKEGPELTPASGSDGAFGSSVALSSDGTTALIGSPAGAGAVGVAGTGSAQLFDESGGTWAVSSPFVGACVGNAQICANTGHGELGAGMFGSAVAIAADASSVLIGGPDDGASSSDLGAAWSFGPGRPVDIGGVGDLPGITGSLAVGGALSCSNGVWTNSPTGYAYQWSRDGTAITGATGSTYTVTAGDQGHKLTCTVTALNVDGTGTATSLEALVANSGLTISPNTDPLLAGQQISATMTPPAQYASGSALTYAWGFGDGSAAPGSSPTIKHAFSHAGVFTISVSVSDAGSVISHATENVVVVYTQPPTASFTILRAPVSSSNRAASTDVTSPVTVVPQASLPQESATSSDSIVREDFWLGGDRPPDPPDITCFTDGVCAHYTGSALVPLTGLGEGFPGEFSTVPGETDLGTGPLSSGGGKCVYSFSSGFGPPHYINLCKGTPTYSPTGGFESFSINFWNAALAQIGNSSAGFASTPQTPTLPGTACDAGGCELYTGPVGYTPLADVDLDSIDGYQGEQGIPYGGCLPGYSYPEFGVTDPYETNFCDTVTSLSGPLELQVPNEHESSGYNNINTVRFGPYDLSQHGVDSVQQLEDQWNFLYNYATVVGVDTPLADQTGPATGATAGTHGSVNPRQITMVAYDAEGVASAPVTQNVPLTAPSSPQLSFCMEDLSSHSQCVTTPQRGETEPFSITAGDTLKFNLNPAPNTQDPILYYAISVGQPNTANVTLPAVAGGGSTSDCNWPSGVGSWVLPATSFPPSQTTGDPNNVAGSSNSGGVQRTNLGFPTGPPDPHRVGAAGGRSAPSITPVPDFGGLEDGAFPLHDCQGYADRTVNASASPAPLPKSGPNSPLQSARDAAAGRDGSAHQLGHQSASQGAVTNPSSGIAEPVLITTNPDDLEFKLPQGTSSVSIAAYDEAGLGAVTRIDGLVAEPPQRPGPCETVRSATIDIGGHSLAFSGNCMTVIDGANDNPVVYATKSVMDISGIPIAPAPGDAIVIQTNTSPNQFYVAPCSIRVNDLTSGANPCPSGHNGDLYLALGGGSNGAPGLAYISGLTTSEAQTYFDPQTSGPLPKIGGGIPKDTETGCSIYGPGLSWSRTPGATYDGFTVVTDPCFDLSSTGHSRVAFWDSLPPGFGNGASTQPASSQVILYGSDVPAVTDLSSHSFANVARGHHPKPVIAGSFPTLPARFSSDSETLPGYPKLPSCPPSTNLKSGLTIPQDTDMGPISLPAGASFCYVQKTGDFIGSVDVKFPDDLPLPINKVKIGIEIGHGRLIDAGGEVSSGTGIDLPPTPVLLKDLKFDIQTDPTVVAGAITAAVADIINITGGVIVDAYHHSATTPEVSVEGNADIEGIQFGNFAIDFTPQGIGMHVTISKDFGVGSIDIKVQGAVGTNGDFYLTGGGHACLWYCLGVNGLVSSYGLAACGSISLLSFTFSGGLGVAWQGPDTGVHAFLGCDLQPYIPPSLSDIPGQATDRAGPLRTALSHPTTLPVLAPGSSPSCNAASDPIQPAGCLKLHQSGMCPLAHPKQAGCTSAVVAVQVHSLVSQEAPGGTPLVTLTGPGGDTRTLTTPTQPGYYGLDGTAPISGGTSNPGQTMEESALIDQNPVPADDLVSTSSAYCAADAGATFSPTASSCPKVTTTTVFVEDPGPGEWRLGVDSGSPPVIDYAVSQQQPPVSPAQFHPAVSLASITGHGTDYTVRIGRHTFPSSMINGGHLLIAPSLMRTTELAGLARAGALKVDQTVAGLHETAGDLDVPGVDLPSLRGLILKLPDSFHGTATILDEGTADGQPASQVLTPALGTGSLPKAGLPVVFEPMLDAGAHQRLVAFLSDSDGIPSRVLTLSSFRAPAADAPSKPKIIKAEHVGNSLEVYFGVGDASVSNGVNLALTEPNGVAFQQTFTGPQLHALGALHGIGLARQAGEYMVTIADVDPSMSVRVVLDTVNDGLLSRPSRIVAARASVQALSFSRLRLLIAHRLGLVFHRHRHRHAAGDSNDLRGGSAYVLEPIR